MFNEIDKNEMENNDKEVKNHYIKNKNKFKIFKLIIIITFIY